MQHDDEDDNSWKKWTVKKAVHVMMQELVDVRRELKEEIREVKQNVVALDRKFDDKINGLDQKLTKHIRNLSFKVDQNHLSFMTNLDAVDKRVTKLEGTTA